VRRVPDCRLGCALPGDALRQQRADPAPSRRVHRPAAPRVHALPHLRSTGKLMANATYNPLPRLIEFAAGLRFEDLPENVVHETMRRVLDSLATAFGALTEPRAVERWTYLSKRPIAYDAGGWAYGVPHKRSLRDAAFLNSTLTRSLDFNDTYPANERAHPS